MIDKIGPLTIENLTDRVYQILKEGILNRHFTPGQRLDLAELEQAFGISRTPIKDAINRLQVEGLVHIVPRRGTFVAQFHLEDIRDYMEIRTCIELFAARCLVERIKPALLGALEDALRYMEALYDPESEEFTDYTAFLDHDRRFHNLIVSALGNRKLQEMYENLKIHTHIAMANYVFIGRRAAETIREHRAILEAIQARDQKRLDAALAEHLKAAQEQALHALTAQQVNCPPPAERPAFSIHPTTFSALATDTARRQS